MLADAKYNCVLWPETCRAWHESLLAVGCPDPAPPPIRAVLAPVAPASFPPAPHSAGLVSFARAGKGRQGSRRPGEAAGHSWAARSGRRPLKPSSVFRSLFRLCSPLPASAQSLALTRPLFQQGARAWCPPKIPPTRRPAERAFTGEGRKTGLSSRAQKKGPNENQAKQEKQFRAPEPS